MKLKTTIYGKHQLKLKLDISFGIIYRSSGNMNIFRLE